jgi:HK97 family phage portal protein
MNWPRLRLVREKALTGTPEVLETLAARQMRPFPGLGGTNINTSKIQAAFSTAQSASYAWMYGASPAVRTVVDLVARNVGQLDLRLYEELSESERVPRPDHNAAISLQRPSPEQTRDQFVRSVMQDYLLFWNAYAVKFRAGNGRLSFKRLPASRVEILGQSLFDPEGYKVYRLDGTYVILTPEDVVHWRGENPDDPRLGLSPLETLRSVVAEDAALQATLVELSKSGLAGPAWVYRPLEAPEWSNLARQGFEEDLTNRLRRSNRTPPVMEEGMELRSDAMSPKDAEMLAVRKYAVQQVASLYGVPLGMVGLADDVAAAQSEFYADTLPPYCEAFTRQLDLSVLQVEYGETEFCFEFNLDEKHMGDDRLAALVSATGRPVMLTDEARARLNLPPVDGGDELVTPMNVTVGEKPSPAVMPIQDPNGPPQDGSHRIEAPKSASEEIRAIENGNRALVGGQKKLEVSTVPRMKGDMARQQRYIDEAAGILEKFYARQYRQVKGPRRDKGFERDKWDRELSDDLHLLVRSIVDREGGRYASRFGADDFDMRQVENYLKATAEDIAEALNGATQRDIEAVGLEDAFKRARNQRAGVAAASIGARATVFARIEAAKQAPHPEHRTKTWVADTDRHADLDGATVSLNSSWGGIEPGSEPNCRCTAVIS